MLSFEFSSSQAIFPLFYSSEHNKAKHKFYKEYFVNHNGIWKMNFVIKERVQKYFSFIFEKYRKENGMLKKINKSKIIIFIGWYISQGQHESELQKRYFKFFFFEDSCKVLFMFLRAFVSDVKMRKLFRYKKTIWNF